MSSLGFLEQAWDEARAGTTGLVLIGGEAGSGKTHLLREHAHRQAGRALHGLGPSWWQHLLSRYHELLRQERQPDFVSAARQVAPEVRWPQLGASTQFQTDEQLWLPLIHGLGRLARRLGGLNVLLDNASHFTPEDWQALTLLHRRLAAGAVPCLIAVGGVPWEHPTLLELQQQGELLRVPVQTLVLPPLDDAALHELVQEVTGRSLLPPNLLEWLREHGEGHPLRTQQMLQLLRAEGYLNEVGATWDFTPPAATHWTGSLEKILRQRLGGLNPLEREVLGALAVTHSPLSLPVWGHLAGLDEATLQRLAAPLRLRRLVQVTGSAGESLYALQHPSFAPLLLSQVSAEQQRTWHARSVQVTSGSVQAEHAHAAADPRAPQLIQEALAQAAARRQFSEVTRLGQLLPRQALPDDVRGLLALAAFHTGQTERALQLSSDLHTPLGRLARYEANMRLGRNEEALTEIEAAEKHPDEEASTWRVRRWLCLMQLGRAEEARADLQAQLPALTGLPRARALDALSDLLYDLGDLRGSLNTGREAIGALREAGEGPTLAVALSNFGGTSGHFGQWQEGIAALQEALELQTTLGYLAYQMYTISNLGFLNLCAGHYPAAEKYLHEAVRLARARRDERVLAAAHTNLSTLKLRQGDLPAARRAFDEAVAPDVRETATPYEEAELLVFEGQAQAALDALQRDPGVLHRADPAPEIALVYLACQQPEKALDILTAAFREDDHPARRATLHYLTAAAQATCAPNNTLGTLRQALQAAQEAGHQPLTNELQLALDRVQPALTAAEREKLQTELQQQAAGHLLRLNLIFPAPSPIPEHPRPAPQGQPALLFTLGSFRCLDDQGREALRGSKPRALLTLLLCASLSTRQGVPRQELIAALWPDLPPEQAEQVFRTTLKRLRAGLGRAGVIESQRGEYRLTNLHADVTYFLNALERHDYPNAVGWYQGDFLPGIDLPQAEELRAHLRQRYRQMLLQYHVEHPPELAASLLENLLRSDPLDLEALRITAQLLAELGWHSRQQQLIERSEKAFLNELGELPPEWAEVIRVRP